jgi:predicted GIY-YIG superfamily endonuclease
MLIAPFHEKSRLKVASKEKKVALINSKNPKWEDLSEKR